MASNNNGVLSATTAFGKTVTAIGLIARRGVNTLILVHTKALLDQWVKALEQFLTINTLPEKNEGKRKQRKPLSPIGTLSSTGNKLHGIIDIALMQSCISDNGKRRDRLCIPTHLVTSCGLNCGNRRKP